MARIRTVKPEYWSDEKVMELSFPSRLLFIGLWNFADREGRMVYSPKRIRAQVFPGDALDVCPLLDELKERGLITVYAATNATILQVTNWHKHQLVSARELPSALPANAAVSTVYSLTAQDMYKQCLGSARDMMEVVREVEVGMEVNNTSCVEPEKPGSPQQVAGTLPTLQGDYIVTIPERNQYARLYPAVDVVQEFRSMKAWLLSNPRNQKTKSGIKRFINNWLSKAQNRAPVVVEPQKHTRRVTWDEMPDADRMALARVAVREKQVNVPERLAPYVARVLEGN